MLPRQMTLSVEAASALLQILGIMHDNAVSDDPTRTASLEAQIRSLWTPEALDSLQGPDEEVALDIEDAAALLGGLAYTEVMSVEFPWFPMVQWTVDFVTAELRPLWTDQEWARLGPH